MSRRGHTRGSGISMQLLPMPRLGRQLGPGNTGILPGHAKMKMLDNIVLIRKSLANGVSMQALSEQIGVSVPSLTKFARQRNMVRNRSRGHKINQEKEDAST